MDFLACASFLLTLMSIIFISASTDQTNITAEPGQNASLPCRSPDNKPVLVLEWIRPDLGSEYVLLYRNRKINTEHQHVMFRDRVDLQDRQMKDGNVSLALRNVTPDDRGAYECRVVPTNSWVEAVLTVNLVILTPAGDSDGGKRDGSGRVGQMVGVSVGVLALVIIAAVGWFIYKRDQSPKPNKPTVDPAESELPLTDQNRPDDQ